MGIFFQNLVHHADVVELVDTLDSGSSAREGMKVQVLSSALKNPVVRYRVFRFCVILSGRKGSSDIPFYNVTSDLFLVDTCNLLLMCPQCSERGRGRLTRFLFASP